MSPHDIILKGDNTLFKVGDTLDKKIYARILKFISQNSNYGKVSIDKKELAILDDIILKEIRDSGYNIEVNNYFKLFNELENAISKEQFSTMGYKERVELLNTNPTLYNQLNG